MAEREKEQTFGLFEFVGAIFRFPIFLLIVCLKLFLQFPLELIIFKIFGSFLMFAMAMLSFIKSLLFSDRRGLKESKDTLKEIFELLLDFECFDFSGTIKFLKYGHFN